jgi:exodeoxyribonuclease-3
MLIPSAGGITHLQDWLAATQPDVVLLQELKCTAEEFPMLAVQGAGYDATVLGQKTWNGVAVLTRQSNPHKPEITLNSLNLPDDTAARYLEVQVGQFRLASVYVPNGQSLDSEKFSYKLSFLTALEQRLSALLASELPVVVGGDFNIAPAANDVYDPRRFDGDVLYALPVRQAWRRMINQGWIDAPAPATPASTAVQLVGLSRQCLASGSWVPHRPSAAPVPPPPTCCAPRGVDSDQRALEQPSDHAPVWVELA